MGGGGVAMRRRRRMGGVMRGELGAGPCRYLLKSWNMVVVLDRSVLLLGEVEVGVCLAA